MKTMLDTNVILDVLLKREPFFTASCDVMRWATSSDVETYVSASAITDIYYLLRKGMSDAGRAKESIEQLLNLLTIADVLAQDVRNAIKSDMRDFEDALLSAVSLRIKADMIITRNGHDFTQSPVTALSPDAFLKMIIEDA